MKVVRTYIYCLYVSELPLYIARHLRSFHDWIYLSLTRVEEDDNLFTSPNHVSVYPVRSLGLPEFQYSEGTISEGAAQISQDGSKPTQILYVDLPKKENVTILSMLNNGWNVNQADEDFLEEHGPVCHLRKCGGVQYPGVF